MIIFLFTSLIVLDLVLFVTFLRLNRKSINMSQVLLSLTEERDLLNEKKEQVMHEIQESLQTSKSYLDKIKSIASEVDQDLLRSRSIISDEVKRTVANMKGEIDNLVSELSKKQMSLEVMNKRMDKEKLVLQKNIELAQSLSAMLLGNRKYDEVVADLESRKYDNARELIASGRSIKEVATDLGLSVAEVKAILEMQG